MPHEWLAKPKKRRGKDQEQPKFRLISHEEEIARYKLIHYKPNPNPVKNSNKTKIDVVIGPEQEDSNNNPHNGEVKTEPTLPGSRPKVKTVVSDVLTGSGIS